MIVPRTWRKKEFRAAAVRPGEALLSEARAKSARMNPPSAAVLTVPSETVYPRELIREALAEGIESNAYRLQAGKFSLQFVTPPLAHYLSGGSAPNVYRPTEGIFDAAQYAGMVEAVTVVQADSSLR